jgi:hypothetical protein
MTCGQNSTTGVQARMPVSLWRGRVSADRTSRVTTSTTTSLQLHHRLPLAGVGCTALADHLRAATRPSKFRSHLPEKSDDTSNPSELLQVYVTAITAAGGDTAVMATYFHVALFGPARTWLMNLALGSVAEPPELFQLKCLSPTLEARPHLNRNNTSVPRI